MSTESDQRAVELAFDLLEDADVMQEFEDTVWLAVDKATWEEFVQQSNGGWSCGT